MTKNEFIERWKRHVAGMALFGWASDRNDSNNERAQKLWDIPKQVEELLGKMFDDVQPKAAPAPATPAQNNKPATPQPLAGRKP